jgi:hypothetical protein
MRYEIDYDIAPERGEVVLFDGRPFVVLGYEAYVRRDGTSSSLIIWKTTCADCGVEVVVKSGFRSKTITKRCEEHRKRGAPATPGAMARMMRGRIATKAKRN